MSRSYRTYDYEPRPRGNGGSRLRWLALGGAALLFFWRRRKKRDDGGPPADEVERGHRPVDDTPEGGVVLFAVGLAVLIAAVLGGAALLMNVLETTTGEQLETALPFSGYTMTPDPPQLQTDPAIELREVREREDRLLHGYRWVDRDANVVSIPIDRAMSLIADSIAAHPAELDSVPVLTESGYVYRTIALPRASAPPFLGRSPEPYSVNPDLARILEFVDVKEDTVLHGRSINLKKLRGPKRPGASPP